MQANDQEIVGEISEELGRACGMLGLPGDIGKVWSNLYFKNSMTQEQIKEEVGCSLSAVSQSLNFLEKIGLIYISGKAERKNIYSAETCISKIKRNHMENALRFYINPVCDLLASRIEDISDKELKKKVANLKNFYSKTGCFIKVILKTPFGKEGKK
jgi:DNA-binding transcriptional regulator GbsR (MarR family)